MNRRAPLADTPDTARTAAYLSPGLTVLVAHKFYYAFWSCVAPALASLALYAAASTVVAAPPNVRAEGAWIRWLPAGVPAGGYATLTNIGEKPVSLIAATSPYFQEISIHRSINRAGAMEMEPVKEIVISPHSRLEFASTGYHLMLIQPKGPLEAHQQIPITLRFADGSSLTVPFEVRRAVAGASDSR
jgi:periplasmic copper chaperone A